MVGEPAHKEDIAHWIHDRTQFVRHNRNSVYIAISAIARKMAMQEARVSRRVQKKSGSRLVPVEDSHPLVQLFREVNPFMNEWELWYYNEGWKLLTGDSYIWKARNGFGTVRQLWPIPSQFVWAVPSSTKFVRDYRVESFFRGMGTETYLRGNDVLHIQEPNLNWEGTGRFYGFAPLSAAGSSVDIENNMFERLNNSFRNYAQPGQIFSTDVRLTEPQLRQAYTQIISQHSLAEHYGRPMITHSGLKPMMQTSSIKEMDYSTSLEVTLRLTLAVFGVPMAVVGLVQDVNRCLDEETECLTDSGWVNYKEIDHSTKIACYDRESQTVHYRRPSGVFRKHYSGKMLHWKSDVADIMVTPNHRILGVTEGGKEKTMLAEEWTESSRMNIYACPPLGAACEPASKVTIYPKPVEMQRLPDVPSTGVATLKEVADITGKKRRTVLSWVQKGWLKRFGVQGPRGETLVEWKDVSSLKLRAQGSSCSRMDPVSVDADDWLEFLGWFVSEGSTNVRVTKSGVQSTVFLCQKADRHAEEIQGLLDRMPFRWTRSECSNGMVQWACYDAGLRDHLAKHCGTKSKNKRVPGYVKDYPAASLKKLLDAAILGDGSKSKTHDLASYCTTSRQLSDDIQEIAVKCGYRASVTESKRKTKSGLSAYTVNICMSRSMLHLRNSKNLSEVDYDGDIWCVEVPTSYFVVRRNGKVHITGNSNMLASMQQFCEGVINPRLVQNGQHLTYNIAREFDDDLVVHFDMCTVNDAEALRKAVETAASNGALTPNEIRSILFGAKLSDFETGGDRPVVNAGATEAAYGQVGESEIEDLVERELLSIAEESEEQIAREPEDVD